MRNKFFKTAFALLLMASPSVFASASRFVTLKGKLLQVHPEFVLIQTETKKVKVPRSALRSVDGYIVGKADVTVEVPFLELIQLNRKTKP